MKMLSTGSSVITGTPDMNRFANQKAFLYSCYQNGLFFQQQELGKSEEKLSKETRLLGLQQTLQSLPMF